MLYIGIDSGSTTTKAIAIEGNAIVNKILVPTGFNPKQTIEEVYRVIKNEREDVYTTTTGYGRELLNKRDKSLTEITCHARGAAYLCSNTKTIVDVGGQDSKVIAMDENFNVTDFLMNDKCAAGTGRFIEVMMRILQKDLVELDDFIKDEMPVAINSMCAVFAESEVIGLLGQGESPQAVAMGVVDSICRRTANFSHRMNIDCPIFFSGGLAQSKVIRKSLEKHLGVPVYVHEMSQYTGAIGAALMGSKQHKAK